MKVFIKHHHLKIKMPRYCSQCGLEGHTKRNVDCPINKIDRKYQLIAEQIDACQFPYQKLDILDRTIIYLKNDLSGALRNYSLSERTAIYYHRSFLESKAKRIDAQKNGTMEEVLRVSDEMKCAEANFKIMKQCLIVDTHLKNKLREQIRRFYVTQNVITMFTKHTSDYLKEMTMVNDLTLSEVATCDCPLCYDTVLVKDALQTNCSHSYCVECVKNFSTSIKDKTTSPACPCCRTTITEITTGNSAILVDLRTHLLRL